jgi:hypothetical protein
MTPYDQLRDIPPERSRFVGNDIFWKSRPYPRDNGPLYLMPGQTEWFGPSPLDGDDAHWLRWHRRYADDWANDAAKVGIKLHVQTVGAYIRTHRLHEGPVRKLSDWRQLPPGVPMLLNPHPTSDDVEKALNRVKYMRTNDFGLFRSWTDDTGALWTERL